MAWLRVQRMRVRADGKASKTVVRLLHRVRPEMLGLRARATQRGTSPAHLSRRSQPRLPAGTDLAAAACIALHCSLSTMGRA